MVPPKSENSDPKAKSEDALPSSKANDGGIVFPNTAPTAVNVKGAVSNSAVRVVDENDDDEDTGKNPSQSPEMADTTPRSTVPPPRDPKRTTAAGNLVSPVKQNPSVSGAQIKAASAAPPAPASAPPTDSFGSNAVARPLNELPVLGKFGRFALLGRIAFGGMAEIFLARDENPRTRAMRHIVIKRVLPHVADDQNFVQMFLDEARLAIRLQHPNICHIYEFGETDGSYFIAMEWVNGVPLGKLLRKARDNGGMPFSIAARVIAQIGEALHYAHRARDDQGNPLGIVHRDVSLQNIMVSYEGTVKLLDFGVAKASSHSTKTSAGVVKGKLSYMAPEQARGEEVDLRADVFALGICLYEALTCRALYHRTTEYETLRAIIDGPVPSSRVIDPSIPVALDEIVQKALQKNRNDRFADAGEMQNALERYLAENREVVNSGHVGEFVRKLYADEIVRGPLVDSSPFVLPMSQSGERAVRASNMPPPPTSGENIEPPADSISISERTQTGRLRLKRERNTIRLAIVAALVLIASASVTAWWLLHLPTPKKHPAKTPVALLPNANEATNTLPTTIVNEPLNAAQNENPSPAEAADAAVIVPPTTVPPNTTTSAHEHVHEHHHGQQKPPAGHASLSLNTKPWSRVYVGNNFIGITPFGNVDVPSGEINLRFVDRDGARHHKVVHLHPSEHANMFFDLVTLEN